MVLFVVVMLRALVPDESEPLIMVDPVPLFSVAAPVVVTPPVPIEIFPLDVVMPKTPDVRVPVLAFVKFPPPVVIVIDPVPDPRALFIFT
jgi:hypothetical protein